MDKAPVKLEMLVADQISLIYLQVVLSIRKRHLKFLPRAGKRGGRAGIGPGLALQPLVFSSGADRLQFKWCVLVDEIVEPVNEEQVCAASP